MTFKLRDRYVSKLQEVEKLPRLAGGWLKGVDMLLNVSIVVLTANFIVVTLLKKGRWFTKKNNSHLLVLTLKKTNKKILGKNFSKIMRSIVLY